MENRTWRRRLRLFRRNRDGAMAVEFAILIAPLLAIVLGIIDFALLYWRAANLDQAALQVHSEVRQGLTNAGDYRQRLCDAAGALIACDSNLAIRVAPLPNVQTGAFSDSFALTPDEPFVLQVRHTGMTFTPFLSNVLPNDIIETRLTIYGVRNSP